MTALRAVGIAVALVLSLAACSSDSDPRPTAPDPTAFTPDDLSCDQDIAALSAMDTVERVGGLQKADYSVRFAQSTRLGVVALVVGDAAHAFTDLHDNYGVELVSPFVKEKDTGKVSGFAQVRDLVTAACS